MEIQVSRCYYHPERGAVATCTKCGVGICKECALKNNQGIILCYRCENDNLKQEHKEHRKRLKEAGGRFRTGKEFIIPGIIGILIATAFGIFAYMDGVAEDFINESIFLSLIAIFMFEYLLFSIPFGYIAINDLFAPKYRSLTMADIILQWSIKFMVAFLGGWIFFTFYLIRFIVRKNRANKT